MQATTKRTLSNVLVGQLSNARAIEGAKTAPWWIAVILFLIGTFLPVIPIMVSQGNSYGAQFMSGTLYGYDQYLATTSLELANSEQYRFALEGEKLLAYKTEGGIESPYINTWQSEEEVGQANAPDMTPIAHYNIKITVEDGQDGEGHTQYITYTRRKFNVYYSDRPYDDSNTDFTIYNMLKTLTGRHYELYSEDVKIYNGEITSDNEKNYYNPSFLLLTKDGLYSYIYKTDTYTLMSYTGTGYNWKGFADTHDFFLEQSTVAGIESNVKDLNYVKGAMENWKVAYNKAFGDQKLRNFWMLSGVFYAIYVGLTLFMGLMMWLLTRGKRNPNRGLKVYTCLAIAGWICVTPALLAMILGFIIPAAQQVAFIILIGIRTMWLSMRQLNPKY